MVEPTNLVERDIGVAIVELDGGADKPAGGGLTESEQVVGHVDSMGFQWLVVDARLIEVVHAPLLCVESRWERRATHAFFHHRKPKSLAFLSFLQVNDVRQR